VAAVSDPPAPTSSWDAGDLLDDPLSYLERFAGYLRDRADRTELLMAARWAALLIEAVERGAVRERLGWPAHLFLPSVAVAAHDLAAWAQALDAGPGSLIVPCAVVRSAAARRYHGSSTRGAVWSAAA
jgi:hypothetical protein